MTTYTWFNLLFAPIAVIVAFCGIRSWPQARIVLRTAFAMVFLAYPWDYFAVTWGAWDYPDPGLRLFLVPINDSVFIFTATLVTATLLSSPSVFGAARPESDT
jgi:lycopene cyclase domain-containing protein